MNFEEFKNEVINFFKDINSMALEEYKNNLPKEKKQLLENFDENNIIFYNSKPLLEQDKLYINNNYFKMENGLFNIDKFNSIKPQFIQKYLEKFILFEYNKDANKDLMHYVSEYESNKLINKNNLHLENLHQYTDNYTLTLIVNKTGINYKELICNGNIDKLLNSINDEKIKNEYLNQNEKEQIAQVYGVDLNNIEVVFAKNKKFYKIQKDNNYIMLEDKNQGSIVEQFKDYQNNSSSYQSLDSKQNSDKIIDTMQQQKIQINLIPINELPNYRQSISSLNNDQMACLNLLYNNKNKLDISFIDIENGIALDKNGKCMYAEKNSSNEQYEIKTAKTEEYNNKEQKSINETNDVIQDINDVQNNSDDNNLDNKVDDTPDYSEEKQNEEVKHRQKILVRKNPFTNKNGFIDVLILSIITGFIGGFSTGILLLLMK